MKFKDNWNKTDEKCPHCGNVVKPVKGITKQNIKRLFLTMPKLQDWITIAIIVMILLLAWAYNHDTAECRELIKNIDEVCMKRVSSLINTTDADINIPEFDNDYNP